MDQSQGNVNLNELRTKYVVIITTATMILEIWYGLITKSMALLADGIHMGSHALAIGISWMAYVIIRKVKNEKGCYDCGKILSLSAYSNGLLLLIFAGLILAESINRFFHPLDILYKKAVMIASLGLLVNLLCAVILFRKKNEADFNIRSAYLHVLADALTSISAIAGIVFASIFNIQWLDTLGAILCFFVILKWSADLLRTSGKELLRAG